MGKLEQIKAMKKNKGIKHLLESAAEILGNPIAMFDTNYSLIAFSDVVTDDPIWNELVSTGTFSMETQKFFASEYFTFEVANADRLVILKNDKLKYDRVLAHIFNRDHIKVALLVMVECNVSSSEDDLIAFYAFANKISATIRNDEFFTAYGKSYHNDLIVRILNGEIKDTQIYTPHIQILYDGFESCLFLAIAEVRESGSQNGGLEYIKDLLMAKYKSCKFAIYSGFIVMIISSKRNVFNSRKFFGKNDDFFEKNNIFVGVSGVFENLYHLRRYYDEAVAALKTGAERGGSQRIYLFGEDND